DRLLGRGRVAPAAALVARPKTVAAATVEPPARTGGKRRIPSFAVMLLSVLVLVGAALWSVRGELPAAWRAVTSYVAGMLPTKSAPAVPSEGPASQPGTAPARPARAAKPTARTGGIRPASGTSERRVSSAKP